MDKATYETLHVWAWAGFVALPCAVVILLLVMHRRNKRPRWDTVVVALLLVCFGIAGDRVIHGSVLRHEYLSVLRDGSVLTWTATSDEPGSGAGSWSPYSEAYLAKEAFRQMDVTGEATQSDFPSGTTPAIRFLSVSESGTCLPDFGFAEDADVSVAALIRVGFVATVFDYRGEDRWSRVSMVVPNGASVPPMRDGSAVPRCVRTGMVAPDDLVVLAAISRDMPSRLREKKMHVSTPRGGIGLM